MTPLTMHQLSERFDPRPLIPEEILAERRAMLERLDIQAPLLHGEATSWAYHVDPLAHGDHGPDDPLVQSLALMEYPNDPGWLDVHPIVRDLLRGEPSG